MDKSVLYSGRKLIITLIDEGDTAHIAIQSTKNGPDLRVQDDVVVVVDGHGAPVTIEDRLHARAELPDWLSLVARGFHLMVRVGEFFQGWEFGDDLSDAEDDDDDSSDDGDDLSDEDGAADDAP